MRTRCFRRAARSERGEEARRLKRLEEENRRLKRLLAEAELDKAILKEALEGDW
ncbi:MAG: hypothetical protein ACE5JI_09435 [Acidobacteriota bacterium]